MMLFREDDVLRLVEQKFAEMFGIRLENEAMATIDEVKKVLYDLRGAAQSLVSKAEAPKDDTSAADNDEIIGELRAIGGLIDEAVGKLDPKPADDVQGGPVEPN